jgi:adenylate cyclase
MAKDKTATVKTLASYREIIVSLIRQHRTHVADSLGDNLLAEFSSVGDAVQCAVAVQSEFQTCNAELAENRIYGDGVNVAARLEALADPGAV